jgi:hypothetical protein
MIKFTRHAERRKKLYKITDSEIDTVIRFGEKRKVDEGKYTFVHKIKERDLLLKVVCKIIDNV